MMVGNLILWAVPAVFWPLTFANVHGLNVIFSSWLEFAVSNIAPLHYIATTIFFIVAYLNHEEKIGRSAVSGITK